MFRQTAFRLSQKSRSKSSEWFSRQNRDPYVKRRRLDPAITYRARSAFKLLEMNDECQFLDHEDVKAVVDLGAAPGGWSQVVADKFGWNQLRMSSELASFENKDLDDEFLSCKEENHLSENGDLPTPKRKRTRPRKRENAEEILSSFDPLNIDVDMEPKDAVQGRGTIVALDLLEILPIPGVRSIQADFLAPSTTSLLQSVLCSPQNPSGKVDVVLSDMAANITGHVSRDSQSSLQICEAVFEFAMTHLRTADRIGRRKGGVLLIKFFAHPLLENFRKEKLEPRFNFIRYIKPKSSHDYSTEGYFLCQGWQP